MVHRCMCVHTQWNTEISAPDLRVSMRINISGEWKKLNYGICSMCSIYLKYTVKQDGVFMDIYWSWYTNRDVRGPQDNGYLLG